jgi:threonine dehydrogenase-like Zn-dependent dehydrogenase
LKAIVKYKDGKDGLELRELPRPEPKPDEVEIQIKAAGICGSDLLLYNDHHAYRPPVIMGHEFSGVISRVGGNVTDFAIGERVICEASKYVCGKCEFCRTGKPALCVEKEGIGFMRDGCMAEYYCTPESLLFRIPEAVGFEEAAMAEPCAVAVQALIVRSQLRPGEVVVVQGVGTIALMCAMVAKAAGAGRVIMTGLGSDVALRFPVAVAAGADKVVNVEIENLSSVVNEETNGLGADVVVDATGSEAAIRGMVSIAKKTGRLIAIGETANGDANIRWNDLIFKACSIIFSFGLTFQAWKIALQMIEERKVNVKLLHSHSLPFSEFKRGFELADEKAALKVILEP